MQQEVNHSISDFKLFQRFHFFYYSHKDNETFFLLRQKKNGQFCDIRGHLEPYDPAILFSVGRKIVETSCGLLTQHNLEFFAEGSSFEEINRDMLQLCRPRQQIVIFSYYFIRFNYFSRPC